MVTIVQIMILHILILCSGNNIAQPYYVASCYTAKSVNDMLSIRCHDILHGGGIAVTYFISIATIYICSQPTETP